MIKLRPYQEDLVSRVRSSLASGNRRVIMQSTVGSGKTYMSVDIIQKAINKSRRAIFIAPRRQLIYQTVEALEEAGIQCGVIMAGVEPFNQTKIQVASMDTLTRRVGNGNMNMPTADICIIDEAHMQMSKARLDVLRTFPLVIGLTATPMLANGKGMGVFYDDIVEGLPMSTMVDESYLVPMEYYGGASPDMTGAKLNKDGDYTEKFLESVNDKPKLIGEVFKNWKRIAGDRTTLVFAVNKKHAVHLHDEFVSHGVSTAYIDGETPPEDREAIKTSLMSGDVQVVINIGVMVAGVSWNRIDCIVIARQTRNIATWIQIIGRGSRTFPNKENTIVIYHGTNFDELGRVDEPIEWSLDDQSTVAERKDLAKKKAKEPMQITCSRCGNVFKAARECPKCGQTMVAKGEDIPVHAEDLINIGRERKKLNKITTKDDKQKFYSELLGYCSEKGGNPARAAHLYKEKLGVWPNAMEKIILPSTQSTRDYVTSRNIAYRNRRA